MLSICWTIISNWAKFFNIRRNKCNKACSVAGSVHCCAVFTSPCTTGIITAERLLYRSHGQGDARARPASILMADYTMPLRGHGIMISTNGMPLIRHPIFMADSFVYVMLLTFKGGFFACFCVYTGMKGRYSKTDKGMY